MTFDKYLYWTVTFISKCHFFSCIYEHMLQPLFESKSKLNVTWDSNLFDIGHKIDVTKSHMK